MAINWDTWEADTEAALVAFMATSERDAATASADLAALLRTRMEAAFSAAEVSFSAGEITGTDSGGDTHANLTASGGSVG